MLPQIRQTDRLLLNHDLSTLRRGSIIVFFQDGQLHAHRLLTVLPGPPRRYITNGNNVSPFDSPIPEEQIAGHVLAIQHGQRMISLTDWRWRTFGWLVATMTLSVVALYAELRRIKQKLGDEFPLPGIDFLRKCSRWLMTTLLCRFTGSPSSENEKLNQER